MKIELPQTYCGRFTLRAPHNIVSGCEILKCIGLEGTAVLVLGRQYSPWRSSSFCPLATSISKTSRVHPPLWWRNRRRNPIPLSTTMTTAVSAGIISAAFARRLNRHHLLFCRRLHCLRPRLIILIGGLLIYIPRRFPTAFIFFSSRALPRTPSEQ